MIITRGLKQIRKQLVIGGGGGGGVGKKQNKYSSTANQESRKSHANH